MMSSLLRIDPIAIFFTIGSSRAAATPWTYCGVTAVSSITTPAALAVALPAAALTSSMDAAAILAMAATSSRRPNRPALIRPGPWGETWPEGYRAEVTSPSFAGSPRSCSWTTSVSWTASRTRRWATSNGSTTRSSTRRTGGAARPSAMPTPRPTAASRPSPGWACAPVDEPEVLQLLHGEAVEQVDHQRGRAHPAEPSPDPRDDAQPGERAGHAGEQDQQPGEDRRRGGIVEQRQGTLVEVVTAGPGVQRAGGHPQHGEGRDPDQRGEAPAQPLQGLGRGLQAEHEERQEADDPRGVQPAGPVPREEEGSGERDADRDDHPTAQRSEQRGREPPGDHGEQVPEREVRVGPQVREPLAPDVDPEPPERALEQDVRHQQRGHQLPQPRRGVGEAPRQVAGQEHERRHVPQVDEVVEAPADAVGRQQREQVPDDDEGHQTHLRGCRATDPERWRPSLLGTRITCEETKCQTT